MATRMKCVHRDITAPLLSERGRLSLADASHGLLGLCVLAIAPASMRARDPHSLPLFTFAEQIRAPPLRRLGAETY